MCYHCKQVKDTKEKNNYNLYILANATNTDQGVYLHKTKIKRILYVFGDTNLDNKHETTTGVC